nr:hypothetical transcript [Hymenolepis microstoma]
MNLTTFIVATVLLLAQSSNAIYFHIKEGSTKCFIEDVPEDTLISDVDKFVRNSDYGVHVEIKDPGGNVVLSRANSFTHLWQLGTTAFVFPLVVLLGLRHSSLDIAIGGHGTDYKEVASKEKLNDIELRIRQLLDQVAMLAKDQDFQRAREEYFRRLSESINSRVTWWSIIQVILLILTGVFQMRNLRSFFLAKKLV